MTYLVERRDDVPFSFEWRDLFGSQPIDGIGRHEIFVAQNDHAQFLKSFDIFGRFFGARSLRLLIFVGFAHLQSKAASRAPHSKFITRSGSNPSARRSSSAP